MYKYEYLLHSTAVCANECQESCANILWTLLKEYKLVILLFYQMISYQTIEITRKASEKMLLHRIRPDNKIIIVTSKSKTNETHILDKIDENGRYETPLAS
jgi:hypothetical protein